MLDCPRKYQCRMATIQWQAITCLPSSVKSFCSWVCRVMNCTLVSDNRAFNSCKASEMPQENWKIVKQACTKTNMYKIN